MFTQHQLELFYYVAKYQGISAGARRMPYGIGQPAISGQMIDLERLLGTALFQRRPFKLTPEGELLYAYIRPFHEGLPALWRRLQDGSDESFCLAADELIGDDFLSAVTGETTRGMPSWPSNCEPDHRREWKPV